MFIQISNVCKIYDEGMALEDVNISIDKGEFVFLTGPSGAGKSTLIKLLFLEERPTKGQILVDNRSIVRLSRREMVLFRRNTGVVFQDFRLLESASVFDNVAFAMKAVERPWQEIKKSVPEVLEWVGLQGKEQQLARHLSGGEQQRVAVARAIINNPMILYADEPTGDLDPDTSEELMKLFLQINKAGTTVVMATHDREIVNKVQSRVIVLRKGNVVSDNVGGWAL